MGYVRGRKKNLISCFISKGNTPLVFSRPDNLSYQLNVALPPLRKSKVRQEQANGKTAEPKKKYAGKKHN